MKKTKKLILIVIAVLAVLIIAIQLIPYSKNHQNPGITAEPAWDNGGTREIAQRACFDCHSNETVWPWYSNFAPISWLVYRDVMEGRTRLNFSEWERARQPGKGEIVEVISEGEMPPFIYLIIHRDAKLSASEKQDLIDGLSNTIP